MIVCQCIPLLENPSAGNSSILLITWNSNYCERIIWVNSPDTTGTDFRNAKQNVFSR